MKKSARQLSFEVLVKIERSSAYSSLALDSALSNVMLDARDKSLVSALVYCVIERRETIDYQLKQYLIKPLKKLKPDVLVILRLGAAQALFMDKIPPSAAVNESVKLARENGCQFAASLINAVLRQVCKNGVVLPDKSDLVQYYSVKYSCSPWLVKKWLNDYGQENTAAILSASIGAEKTVLRVNTLKITAANLKEKLVAQNIQAQDGILPDTLTVPAFGCDISSLPQFTQGLFHVQDTASAYCVLALNARDGDTVFDLCAAPGGKSFTVAQLMHNNGKILAFDLHQSRVKLIEDGAKRLGINIIKAAAGDAMIYNPDLDQADKVLCDVPCSGFGVIGKKPEIKYKNEEDVRSLPEIQLKILTNGARYVKKGGRLIYSTCTLNKDENESVCLSFLEKNSDFIAVKPLPQVKDEVFLTFMPHKDGTDGFFVAAFERKNATEE